VGGSNAAAPCETIHSDGVGQNYYDCNNLYTTSPSCTYTATEALAACAAYATSVGGSASNCSDGWACSGQAWKMVCYSANGKTCGGYCWGYTCGHDAGWVTTCSSCPEAQSATWN
jgi:hypothetical protein